MTVVWPRVKMDFVRIHDTATENISASAHSGHSCLTVIDDGPDDIFGVVHTSSKHSQSR